MRQIQSKFAYRITVDFMVEVVTSGMCHTTVALRIIAYEP